MVDDCVLDGVAVEDQGTEAFLEIGDVAFDGLIPFLTPATVREPTGIGTEVDELLVDILVHANSNMHTPLQ